MGEGKGSTLVHLLVIVLSLTAFGFAIAAERRRTIGTLHKDEATNQTYCIYNSDVATGYGIGAFLFLLSSESLLMGVTKCMCFGSPLAPGGNRAWTIIYFVSSWMTFLVAEACLIAGAKKNAYHTKYRNMIYADNFSCESLRKGIHRWSSLCGCHDDPQRLLLHVLHESYYSYSSENQPCWFNSRFDSECIGFWGQILSLARIIVSRESKRDLEVRKQSSSCLFTKSSRERDECGQKENGKMGNEAKSKSVK
ncbi:hypothetical protein Sango_0104500 [Sesamum angolense]|uniref:Uncharacterized protein n=1 Tax=Sesamum angolense TaxID=2727404 RepID=A0AAE2C6B8_9LAMI|nr:hypothetical protein Sango_0104500 [Sesamum angolense]